MRYFHEGNDETIRVEVNESDTVRDIKIKVQNQEGIPTHLKSLRFNGKRLDDTRFLVSYYKIQDDSKLDLKGKVEYMYVCIFPCQNFPFS